MISISVVSSSRIQTLLTWTRNRLYLDINLELRPGISEAITAVLSPLLVSVNEAISVTEDITTSLSSALLSVSVADNITVSDALTLTLSALTQKIMFMLEIAKQRMLPQI